MTPSNDTLPQQLPTALLKRLRAKKPGRSRDLSAMQAASRFFGIPYSSKPEWWNAVIDALDNCDANWRGKPAPKINPQVAQLLAHTSMRDVA